MPEHMETYESLRVACCSYLKGRWVDLQREMPATPKEELQKIFRTVLDDYNETKEIVVYCRL